MSSKPFISDTSSNHAHSVMVLRIKPKLPWNSNKRKPSLCFGIYNFWAYFQLTYRLVHFSDSISIYERDEITIRPIENLDGEQTSKRR